MEIKELYELPKDMLVKIITTIREETERSCEQKFEVVKKDFIKKCLHAYYKRFCNYCDNYQIFDDKFNYSSNPQASIIECDVCENIACDNHDIIRSEVTIPCFKCKDPVPFTHICKNCASDHALCDDCYNDLR